MTTEDKPPDEKGNGKSMPACSRNGFAQRYRPAAGAGEIAKDQQESRRFDRAGRVGSAGVFAYGGLRRQQQQAVAAEGSPYKKVEPARPDEVQQLSPVLAGVRGNAKPGILPAAPDDPNQLQRQDSDLPKERIVVRRAQAPQAALRRSLNRWSLASRRRKNAHCRPHT